MSKVEHIEAQLGALSRDELRQIRDWLEDLLEDGMEFTAEFESKIQESEGDMRSGDAARTRRSDPQE